MWNTYFVGLYINLYLCSRTELWSTFYDLTKSYKLEQRISQGSCQVHRDSQPAKRNLTKHQHRFNRCSTGPSARAWAQSNAGKNSGSVRRKLDTLKHTSDRHTTGARTFARMCALYSVKLSFGSGYRCLPPKVFSEKIFKRTFLLILLGSRRDPDQVSEEVLASVWFSSR
jgi:hypothetical protein